MMMFAGCLVRQKYGWYLAFCSGVTGPFTLVILSEAKDQLEYVGTSRLQDQFNSGTVRFLIE